MELLQRQRVRVVYTPARLALGLRDAIRAAPSLANAACPMLVYLCSSGVAGAEVRTCNHVHHAAVQQLILQALRHAAQQAHRCVPRRCCVRAL